MRFGDDPARFFASVYEGAAPWDIGAPQPALVQLFQDYPPDEPVLDLGSGTGDLSIWLASRGFRTVGIEFVESAVAVARERAASIPKDMLEFRTADALHPGDLGQTFGSVVDSGFYHLFEPPVCSELALEIAAVLRPKGRYYVLAFGVDLPSPDVPRGITEAELRRHFNAERGWRVVTIRPAEFASTVVTVPAIAACFERQE